MALAEKIWLSLPPEDIEGLPDGPDYAYWNGDGQPPPGIEDVEFFVPPYMRGDVAVPLLPRMRGLRVVQTLTAASRGSYAGRTTSGGTRASTRRSPTAPC